MVRQGLRGTARVMWGGRRHASGSRAMLAYRRGTLQRDERQREEQADSRDPPLCRRRPRRPCRSLSVHAFPACSCCSGHHHQEMSRRRGRGTTSTQSLPFPVRPCSSCQFMPFKAPSPQRATQRRPEERARPRPAHRTGACSRREDHGLLLVAPKVCVAPSVIWSKPSDVPPKAMTVQRNGVPVTSPQVLSHPATLLRSGRVTSQFVIVPA